MGLHDPFGHLKHNLWPKEGSGVKLAIWLPTTKSWESSQFPCVLVACNIPLESSWRKLKLSFRPHFNHRSAHKVMSPQSCKVVGLLTLGISRLPLGSHGTKWHLGVGPMAMHRIYYKGKVVVSPKSGSWWVMWICVCLWWVCARNCSNYTLNNLLFSLSRSEWIIELLVNLPSPIPEL
jgi:hypothetical protein